MKKIVLFLICTFVLTYSSFGLLIYLTSSDYIDFYSVIGQVLFILGGTSPTIFAFIFVFKLSKNKDQEDFKERLLSFRHPLPIWIYAILLPIALGGVFQLGYILLNNHTFDNSVPFYFFIMTFITSIIFGGIEEIGWRGYLQDSLMKKYQINLVLTAFVIGLIWGLWHVPLFFIEEVSHYSFQFIPFLLGAIMFSTYLTWLYAKTKSILLVVLLHASINASANIGVRMEFEHNVWSYSLIIFLTLFGIGLLIHYEKDNKNLTQLINQDK